jgi:pimeloyl-ACP methyl ester carboxylesterase
MGLPVRFLTDRKGRTVAYMTHGRGRPLIFCETGYITHLETLWSHPVNRRFIEKLAASQQVVRFDHPGVGMGDPSRALESFEDRVANLEDVIAGLSLPSVDLFGTSQAGPALIAYAARHPDRVRRMVLFGTFADGTRIAGQATLDALGLLILSNWGLASGTLADVWVPDDRDVEGRRFWARLMRSATSPENALAIFHETLRTDVRDLLPLVKAPTLVLHRRRDGCIRFDLGVEVAAGIPDARMVPLEGSAHLYYLGDADSVMLPALEFLAGDEAMGESGLTSRELEIAELVAEGLTNAEIADRLRISRRTADAHLEHIRVKLGFRSRAQIAAWTRTRATARR